GDVVLPPRPISTQIGKGGSIEKADQERGRAMRRPRIRVSAVAGLALATSLFATVTPPGIAGASASQKVLGIVQITTTDLSTVQATQGATKAAKAAGWSVLVANAQGEPSKAIAAMQDFVNRHVTAIMTTVFESSTLEAGIKAANAA